MVAGLARGLRVLGVLSVVMPAFLTAGVGAEPPTWESLQKGVFLTSMQLMDSGPDEDHNNGIWVIDSTDGSWARKRAFYSSRAIGLIGFFYGDDGHLGIEGDRLVYESWPSDLIFDAFSWRLVNRVPTPNPADSLGWALQGPILDERQLQGTGLEPGRYGFAQCILDDVSNVHHWGPRPCDPLQLPGGLGFIGSSDGVDFFSNGDRPTDIGNLQFHDTFSPMRSAQAHVLSFDKAGGGFWRTDDGGASFFPVSDGVLGAAGFRLDFDFEPFDGPAGAVVASHYHPFSGRHFTFGLHLTSSGFFDERYFFSIDPLNGDRVDYDLPELGILEFYPVSMTSFGEMPERFEQLLPIIAETPGRNDTFWTTDLWFFNPSAQSTTVEVSRITTPDQTMTVELPAFGSRHITNVLAWVGGGAGGDGTTHDALRFVSDYRWGQQLVAAARIWTADTDTGGSFGHVVTAVPYPWAYSNHERWLREDDEVYNVQSAGITVSHVDLDFRVPGQFRHNLGLVNSTDAPLSIEILWGYNEAVYLTYQSDHPEGWRQTVTVDPHSVMVVDLKQLFPSEITETWPPRLAILGERPVPIWFSMVDELTGDATFVPFTNYHYRSRNASWDGDNDPLYRFAVPVAAHTNGRSDSRWVTDLIGAMGDAGGVVDAVYPYFHPADSDSACGGDIPPDSLYVHPLVGAFPSDLGAWIEELMRLELPYLPQWAVGGWRTIFPDIVHAFDECAEDDDVFGGLELVTGSWFSGFSRTYTTRADGGTYGSMLPLYPPGGWPVQHFAGLEVSEATRINIGFFNGDHEHAITHRVTLYAADGTLTAERDFVLESLDSRLESIEQFFGPEFPDGSYGLTVLPLDDVDHGIEGRSWAYVSVIDQLTNDPINLW